MRYTTICDVFFGHFGLVAGQTIMVLVRACRVASERGMDKENLELEFYEASTDHPYYQHTLDTWFKYRSMSGRGSTVVQSIGGLDIATDIGRLSTDVFSE